MNYDSDTASILAPYIYSWLESGIDAYDLSTVYIPIMQQFPEIAPQVAPYFSYWIKAGIDKWPTDDGKKYISSIFDSLSFVSPDQTSFYSHTFIPAMIASGLSWEIPDLITVLRENNVETGHISDYQQFIATIMNKDHRYKITGVIAFLENVPDDERLPLTRRLERWLDIGITDEGYLVDLLTFEHENYAVRSVLTDSQILSLYLSERVNYQDGNDIIMASRILLEIPDDILDTLSPEQGSYWKAYKEYPKLQHRLYQNDGYSFFQKICSIS